MILITDGGTGRLAKGARNREIREKAAKRGLIILLCLPNSTAVSQVMDDLFREFKARCRVLTIAVYSDKIQKRAQDIKEWREKAISAAQQRALELEVATELKAAAVAQRTGEDDEAETPGEGECVAPKEKSKKISVVQSLGNADLPAIVNGRPGDPLMNRPFDFCFSRARVRQGWANVGIYPFT